MVGLNNADKKIVDAMFKWIHSGLAGCSFATKLSTDRNRNKWHTITRSCPKSLAEVDDINSMLELACGEDREAVILIFRDIESVDDLVRLINLLLDHRSWFSSFHCGYCLSDADVSKYPGPFKRPV